jgi:Serine hydrolase (FSH1)
VEAFPPKGFEEFFGLGPYYRFIEPAKNEEGDETDVLDRIRNFPEGATAEDQIRELMKVGGNVTVPTDGNWGSNQSVQNAIDYLYRVMEEDGPFDGIIGYSEGATVAATLLLHEQRRFETEGIPPMFKCALFFAGWPPMNPDLNGLVLEDESDLTISIPTCHISKNSFLSSSS